MMKPISYKSLWALLLAGMPLLASAQQISVNDAMGRATSFLNKSDVRRSAVRGQTTQLSLAYTASQGNEVQFYVFNRGNDEGYIIMGGDERAHEILGYSNSGSFDINNIPDGMRDMLDYYQADIHYAIENDIQPASVSRGAAQRSAAATTARHDIEKLLKMTWSQNLPYNQEIPLKDGVSPVTGCVATAMAQLMKYWNYPTKGKGSHSFEYNGVTYSADFGSTTYDWANMIDSYDRGYEKGSDGSWVLVNYWTEAQGAAVAKLMYHAGVAVDMRYDTSANGGSGSSTAAVPNAFVEYFNYPQTMHHYYRGYFEDDVWEQYIYDELAAGRPVLYSASSAKGGHAFLLHGYQASTNMFAINWGWDGNHDDYFLLTGAGALNPYLDPTGATDTSSAGFTLYQNAYVGFTTDADATVRSHGYVYTGGSNEIYNRSTGESGNQMEAKWGDKISINGCTFGFSDLYGNPASALGYKLTNAQGQSYILDCTYTTRDYEKTKSYYAVIAEIPSPSKLPNGTYTLTGVFKKTASSDWEECYYMPGTPTPTLVVNTPASATDYSCTRISMHKESVAYSDSKNYAFVFYQNRGTATVKGDIGVKVISKTTGQSSICAGSSVEMTSTEQYQTVSISLEQVSDGDGVYEVEPVFRATGTTEWKELYFTGSSYPQYTLTGYPAPDENEKVHQDATIPSTSKLLKVSASKGSTGVSVVEDVDKLFDASTQNKWCVVGSSTWSDLYAIADMGKKVTLTNYVLTEGGDTYENPTRNWATWTIYGSNDTITWTQISKEADATTTRFRLSTDKTAVQKSSTYAVATTTTAYRYFKVVINSIRGVQKTDGNYVMQMSEMALYGTEYEEPLQEGSASCTNIAVSAATIAYSTTATITASVYAKSTGTDVKGDIGVKVTSKTTGKSTIVTAKTGVTLTNSTTGTYTASISVASTAESNDTFTVVPLFKASGSSDWTEMACTGTKSATYTVTGYPESTEKVHQDATIPSTSSLLTVSSGSGTAGATDDEGAAKLFDGIITDKNKWCYVGSKTWSSTDVYAIADMGQKVYLTNYKLTEGGDTYSYPTRNWATWTLYGSNDNKTWTQISQEADATTTLFRLSSDNSTTQKSSIYAVSKTTTAYQYFKVVVNSVRGAQNDGNYVMQMSEMALYGKIYEEPGTATCSKLTLSATTAVSGSGTKITASIYAKSTGSDVTGDLGVKIIATDTNSSNIVTAKTGVTLKKSDTGAITASINVDSDTPAGGGPFEVRPVFKATGSSSWSELTLSSYPSFTVTIDEPTTEVVHTDATIPSTSTLLTVSSSSGSSGESGQEASKLFDGITTSTNKWCYVGSTSWNSTGVYAIADMGKKVYLTNYKLTEGGDTYSYPTRNWATWTLYGSNDNKTWTQISQEADATTTLFRLSSDKTTAQKSSIYAVSKTSTAYQYFKVVINSIRGAQANGNYVMQMSEMALYGKVYEEPLPEGTASCTNITVSPATIAYSTTATVSAKVYAKSTGTDVKGDIGVKVTSKATGKSTIVTAKTGVTLTNSTTGTYTASISVASTAESNDTFTVVPLFKASGASQWTEMSCTGTKSATYTVTGYPDPEPEPSDEHVHISPAIYGYQQTIKGYWWPYEDISEESYGQTPDYLVDGDTSTKWCISGSTTWPMTLHKSDESETYTGLYPYIQIAMDKAYVLTHYQLTEGADTYKYPNRNWATWEVYGSNDWNDDDSWVLISDEDKAEDNLFRLSTDKSTTAKTATYEVQNTKTAYKYYMFIVKSLVGKEGTKYVMQMAELSLFGYDPSDSKYKVPGNVNASKDRAVNELDLQTLTKVVTGQTTPAKLSDGTVPADVNQDKGYTISDITTLIHILNKNK